VRVRGQQSDQSTATTSYALPSIHAVFPNGTAPALGQRKEEIPTSGGTTITLYARNMGHTLSRTVVSIIYRGVRLNTTVTPSREWILQASRVVPMPPAAPPRPNKWFDEYTNTTDGIR
jgi:hypothetical protein